MFLASISLRLALLSSLAVGALACSSEEGYTPITDEEKFDEQLPGMDILLVAINNNTDSENMADWDSDANCFYGNAVTIRDFYRKHNATANVHAVARPDKLFEVLRDYRDSGRQFDRVIVLGHGTPNGPVMCCDYGPQIGLDWPQQDDRLGAMNIESLEQYGILLNKVLKPEGWIYVGACNPSKQADFDGLGTYLDVLSCVSGRHTYGTNTKTACWDVTDRIKALEAEHRFTPGLVANSACDVVNNGELVECLPLGEDFECALDSAEYDWGPCELEGVEGRCIDTNEDSCEGTTTGGLCPGPGNIQCCTP